MRGGRPSSTSRVRPPKVANAGSIGGHSTNSSGSGGSGGERGGAGGSTDLDKEEPQHPSAPVNASATSVVAAPQFERKNDSLDLLTEPVKEVDCCPRKRSLEPELLRCHKKGMTGGAINARRSASADVSRQRFRRKAISTYSQVDLFQATGAKLIFSRRMLMAAQQQQGGRHRSRSSSAFCPASQHLCGHQFSVETPHNADETSAGGGGEEGSDLVTLNCGTRASHK